jgi:asparagine synthase (glutamine-hydrolysing)
MKACVRSGIAPVPTLTVRSLDFPGGFLVWAQGPDVVDTCQTEARTVAIWGVPHDRGVPIDAARVAASPDATDLFPLDGYFAAVVIDASGVRVFSDVLGLAPVYHWHAGGRLLVGSSAALFSEHPLFTARADLTSVVAILLIMHPLEGRTIYCGVCRLRPGYSLHWTSGGGSCERQIYQLPLSRDQYDLPFAAHVDNLEMALKTAVNRQRPTGVLLSGGLDSRLIAGYAHRDGVLSSAFTFGVMSDHDARLARIVAASLSLDTHLFEVPQGDFADCARLAARWEHSQNGFSSLYHWKLIEPLARFGSLVANGLVMDAVVGGSHIRWAYDPGRRSMSFDAFWRHLNRHGLPPVKVRDMARSAEVRDAVDQAHREVEGIFDSLGETVTHRAYAFDLRYRQRFHVARGAWVTSLGSWPIMPILDRDLLAVAGGIPAASLADRRCESAILMRVFPRLAEIPLDRGQTAEALLPRLRHQIARHLRAKVISFGGRAVRSALSSREPRRYVRVYDVNNDAWRAIRQHAEPFRELLHDWFDAERLASCWPGPRVMAPAVDKIVDSAAMKNLIGLALCLSGDRAHPR